MPQHDLSSRLTDVLSLTAPPIALSFVAERPPDVPGYSEQVPSACSFWRAAEQRTFYADAAQHHNCPIGTMVMGFELTPEVESKLGELVGGMCAQNYLTPDEPPNIPTMSQGHAGIVYGPLAEQDAAPDVVLLWVTPQQAMLANEAMGTANWTAGQPVATGRPGCAALPLSVSQGAPVMSFGCAGMRTFTRIADDLLLIAVPGSKLADFAEALEKAGRANDHMLGMYQGMASQFAGYGAPGES